VSSTVFCYPQPDNEHSCLVWIPKGGTGKVAPIGGRSVSRRTSRCGGPVGAPGGVFDPLTGARWAGPQAPRRPPHGPGVPGMVGKAKAALCRPLVKAAGRGRPGVPSFGRGPARLRSDPRARGAEAGPGTLPPRAGPSLPCRVAAQGRHAKGVSREPTNRIRAQTRAKPDDFYILTTTHERARDEPSSAAPDQGPWARVDVPLPAKPACGPADPRALPPKRGKNPPDRPARGAAGPGTPSEGPTPAGRVPLLGAPRATLVAWSLLAPGWKTGGG